MSDAGQAQVIDDAREQGAFSGDTCPELAAQVGALLRGFVGEDPDVSLRDLEVTGDSATALSIVGPQGPDSVVSAEPDPVAFERVNGEWLIGPEPDEGADGARSGGVTPETADGWAASWCGLRVGMTRAEVRRVMGEPTSTHAGESSQDSWSAYQWSFTVFYRFRTDIPDPADEPAYQLQASDISLMPADRRRISCPLTRS